MSGEGKFTPGPWSLAPASVIIGADGRRVCAVPVRLDDADVGDAHLIAASPELYAACEMMVPTNVALGNRNVPDSTVLSLEVTMGELRAVRAALAKARGEQS